jgi:hypothetical protein
VGKVPGDAGAGKAAAATMKTDGANYSCLLVLSPSWLGRVTSSQTAAHRESYAIADLSVNSMGLTLVQHFEYIRESRT